VFAGGLMGGDAIMLLSTQAASSRIPADAWVQLGATLVGVWLGISLLKGDYFRKIEDEDNMSMLDFQMGFDASAVVENALLTWLLFAPCAVLVWAQTGFGDMSMDVTPVRHLRPPEVELIINLFLTMSCFRMSWGYLVPPRDPPSSKGDGP